MPKLLKTPPYVYQKRAAKFAYGRKYTALFMEQGTGKTLTTLFVMARRWRANELRLALILCPLATISVWRRQCAQHLNIPYVFFDNLEDALAYDNVKGKLVIVAINYEKTWRIEKKLRRAGFQMVIADESHKLMHRGSRQSRATGRIGRNAYWRMILTGTPTDGDDLQLWAQFRFLNQKLLGDKWQPFSKAWCRPAGYMGYDRKLRMTKIKAFRRIMRPFIIRIRKDDVLDLPPTTDQKIYVKLEPKARRIYEEVEENLVSDINNKGAYITTPIAATKLMRLQQIAGGYVTDDDGKKHKISKAKVKATVDVINSIAKDRKIVIFARYRSEIDALKAAIKGRTVAVLDGRTKYKDIWITFQGKKNPNVLIVQAQVGGASIDLFAANYAIFFSHVHSYILYDQCRKRLDRNGQKLPVTYIHILGENTVDEDFIKTLDKKGSRAEDVLRSLQRRVKKRTYIMAKETTKKKSAKKNPPKFESPKFGIDALAKEMGIEKATVRNKLREAGVNKDGRAYDFKDAAGVKKVAKKLAA